MTETNRGKGGSLSNTTLTSVYTVPGGYSAEIAALSLVTSDPSQTVEVTVEHDDVSAGVTTVVAEVTLGPGKEFEDVLEGHLLEDGDILKIKASIGGVVSWDYSVVETDGAAAIDYYQFQAPAVTIAADSSFEAFIAKYAGVVSSVSFAPKAAMTGDNTNYRTVSLENRGQAGAGTVKPASLAFLTGVNGVAFDEKAITLSVTPSDLAIAAGDVLSWESIHSASGIVDPGGVVRVGITRS